jgi:hypothetical protein
VGGGVRWRCANHVEGDAGGQVAESVSLVLWWLMLVLRLLWLRCGCVGGGNRVIDEKAAIGDRVHSVGDDAWHDKELWCIVGMLSLAHVPHTHVVLVHTHVFHVRTQTHLKADQL